LKSPEKGRGGKREPLNNIWPHINEEIKLMKTLTVNIVAEQRNLGNLA
jgi:hypothetical protein